MTGTSFGLRQIGQIHVAVGDVDRAVAFYRDVLGMPLLFRFPGMAFFDCGGVRLYLAAAEGEEPLGTSILYYRVADIAAAAAELEGRGVSFDSRPHVVHRDERHELWIGFFRDSEGNRLALMSEVET
ncbi:MAG TPA: VOC family protein [Thermoanaerobaculia bacterium]|nr:VOC family protein [Thermoanaerobaculia bacterium]